MPEEIQDDRQSLVAAIEQVKRPKQGLIDLIFGNAAEETFDTEKVSVDIFDGKRGASKYTARQSKGQTYGLEGWTTTVVKPPLIDEDVVITAGDMKKRKFGSGNINAPLGDNFQKIVNRQVQRKEDRKTAAYTKQVRDLLSTGKVEIIEYDSKGEALPARYEDFKIPAEQIYTVSTSWSDSNADIWQDMEDIDDKINKNSGLVVDRVIVGKTTIKNMLKNSFIKEMLDNRRVDFGEAFKKTMNNGLVHWGNIGGRDIYEFKDFDEDGNPIIPEDAYLPSASNAEVDIYYGSQDVIENGMPTVVESKEVIVESVDEKAVTKTWNFKSAALFALTQSAAFGALKTETP